MSILDFIYSYMICAHRSSAKSLDNCKLNFDIHTKGRTGANIRCKLELRLKSFKTE